MGFHPWTVPAAVSSLVDSVDGHLDRPEPAVPRRPRPIGVSSATTGAALATAAVIVAMARLLAVAVPGIGLVTSMAMVLAVSLGAPFWFAVLQGFMQVRAAGVSPREKKPAAS